MADKERNALSAKLLKAEMLGNADLVGSLKKQIQELDSRGKPDESEAKKKKEEEAKTRLKYITIAKRKLEDSRSLKQMFVKEKTGSAEDETKLFISSCSKKMDDEYEDVRKKKKKEKEYEVRREDEDEEDCPLCVHKQRQDLLLAKRDQIYITLPDHEPLVDGHCVIRSVPHTESLVKADEDCVEQVASIKRMICEMFAASKKEVIFFEYFYKGNRWVNHFTIDCVPVKERYISEARMYFKKAIMECEGTWSVNKKLIDLTGKSVTKAVPRGLSYFWVTFGKSDYGYAHIIEDEKRFPNYFAQEIIGGMLDLDQRKWYRPKRLSFEQQLEQITRVKTLWKKFDI